jgi:hypothetical protein
MSQLLKFLNDLASDSAKLHTFQNGPEKDAVALMVQAGLTASEQTALLGSDKHAKVTAIEASITHQFGPFDKARDC